MKLTSNSAHLAVTSDLLLFGLNQVGSYIYIKDIDRRYVYGNSLTLNLFQRTEESIIGCFDHEFFDLEKLNDLYQNDTRVFDFKETVETEESVYIKSLDCYRTYKIVKKPILNSMDQVIGLLGISTDITELYNLKEQLKQQSITDSLSGLNNRRHFFNLTERYFSESKRYDKPLSLIMMDIDFFKSINDSFGHPAGDAVIEFIGAHLPTLLRKEDILARVGGEEFALLLPNTNLESANIIAEKIRASMSKQEICGSWSGCISPKLSLGLAVRTMQDESFNHLYIRADSALYQAKKNGRNQVFFE